MLPARRSLHAERNLCTGWLPSRGACWQSVGRQTDSGLAAGSMAGAWTKWPAANTARAASAHTTARPPNAPPSLPCLRPQVLPFYQSSVEDEASAAAQVVDVSNALQASATGRDGKQVEEWDYLNSLFKRYNKVLLDELAITREKGRLEQENADLRAILKQYLDGISVNDDVINDANPLLILNSRSNVAAMPSRGTGRITVIEAAHKVMIPQLTSGRQGASM